MWWSVLIGVLVVLVAAFGMRSMLFNQRQPAMVPVRSSARGAVAAPTAPPERPWVRRGTPVRARVGILVRLRGLVGLLALCAGIGAALAVLVGGAVLLIGLSLQG